MRRSDLNAQVDAGKSAWEMSEKMAAWRPHSQKGPVFKWSNKVLNYDNKSSETGK